MKLSTHLFRAARLIEQGAALDLFAAVWRAADWSHSAWTARDYVAWAAQGRGWFLLHSDCPPEEVHAALYAAAHLAKAEGK